MAENIDFDEELDLMDLLGIRSNGFRNDSTRTESETSSSSASTDFSVYQPLDILRDEEEGDGLYQCSVCGEKAGKHSYYGGRVCPSCR